jgi:pimeloyl-ACP methyl ester carboxylesterase
MPSSLENISDSEEFKQFQANVSRRMVDIGGVTWVYYEQGPRDMTPLVMIPGTSGTAEMFFLQILALGGRGYHVIACTPPAYWDHNAWVAGLHSFLSQFSYPKIHLFGTSLGGYLCLHYVSQHPEKVLSLVLCNAFCDTEPFYQSGLVVASFGYMPEFWVKKYVLDSFPSKTDAPHVIDFIVEMFETLTRQIVGH